MYNVVVQSELRNIDIRFNDSSNDHIRAHPNIVRKGSKKTETLEGELHPQEWLIPSLRMTLCFMLCSIFNVVYSYSQW